MYLYDLAKVMQMPGDEIHRIAEKFSQEFSIFLDKQKSWNIGLAAGGRRQWDDDEKLSRALSSLLRHRGQQEGFNFLPGLCTVV